MAIKKNKEKKLAIALRKQGYSYNEISEKLGLAKSTCSVWLKGVKLDQKAIERLVDRQEKGKTKAAFTLRQYRQQRDEYIKQKVTKSLQNFYYCSETKKLLCATLYWAEGSKRSPQAAFTNSDPSMVSTYLTLLRSAFVIDESKLYAWLHLHEYHSTQKQKQYWAKITNIDPERINIYVKPNTGKNSRQGYPGCISIRYGDVRLVKELEFLYNALINEFGSVG